MCNKHPEASRKRPDDAFLPTKTARSGSEPQGPQLHVGSRRDDDGLEHRAGSWAIYDAPTESCLMDGVGEFVLGLQQLLAAERMSMPPPCHKIKATHVR